MWMMREEFHELQDDMKSGEIVYKELSRFGRDYLEVDLY